MYKCKTMYLMVVSSVVVSVLLNLGLPYLLNLFPQRSDMYRNSLIAESLEMLKHHGETRVSSSILVAVIVALSVVLGSSLCQYFEERGGCPL